MRGFAGIFDFKEPSQLVRARALEMARLLRRRGQDWSGVYTHERTILAHERLSIVDVEHGAQPLLDKSASRALAVNEEIYNHAALRSKLKRPHECQTKSGCEIILYLYDEYGPALCDMLMDDPSGRAVTGMHQTLTLRNDFETAVKSSPDALMFRFARSLVLAEGA